MFRKLIEEIQEVGFGNQNNKNVKKLPNTVLIEEKQIKYCIDTVFIRKGIQYVTWLLQVIEVCRKKST